MIKRLSLLLIVFAVGCVKRTENVHVNLSESPEPVPIIELPYFPTVAEAPGWEERGPEFVQYNSTGVRIGGGSGTMVHYDKKENWIYIVSCGHLFHQGHGSANDYKRRPKSVKIEVFYHNEKKLPNTKSYEGQVLCHMWQNSIYDVSLIRFKPDWNDPWVIPVVPLDYIMKSGEWYHNVGCDGRSEVAHYLVKFLGYNDRNGIEELVCSENVARGGRSGGGLLTSDQRLVGITSRSDRVQKSFYSSYRQIHQFLTAEGFAFVLEDSSNLARRIPIVDRNNPQGKYPLNYIPLPID